jgi:hypothetical protein
MTIAATAASEGEPAAPSQIAGVCLSEAIDVVASLAEEAWKIAGAGSRELAMSEVLSDAFAYMVAYAHHVGIDRDSPGHALLKAAGATPELTPAQVNALRMLAASGCLSPEHDGERAHCASLLAA